MRIRNSRVEASSLCSPLKFKNDYWRVSRTTGNGEEKKKKRGSSMASGMKCPGSNKETEGKHLVSFLILNSVDNKTAGSICPVEDLLSPAPQ